jgi:hypothetical protein
MATAVLRHELAAPAASVAAWWRRKDLYVLSVTAAVHVAGVGAAFRWLHTVPSLPGADEALVGLLFTQCFLLGLWAALGGLPTLARWAVVALIFSSGLVAFVCVGVVRGVGGFGSETLELGLLGALFTTGFAAALLPLRGLVGWRVDFDPRYYRHIRRRRGQVGFLDFAALSCGVAAPLAIMRLLAESSVVAVEESVLILIAMALIAVAAGPIVYWLLSWRRTVLAALAAAGWAVVVAWIHSVLGSWLEDLMFFGGSTRWFGMAPELAAFYAGIGTTAAITIGALRLCGLKLLVVPPPPVGYASA